MQADSWKGSWTQRWIKQVSSNRFRNFAVPRTSLLRRLRSFSRAHEEFTSEPRGGNRDADKSTQPFTNPAYNGPFDHVQFTPAKAAPLRQARGQRSGVQYRPYSTEQSSVTDTDSYASSTEFSQSARRRRSHVAHVVIGLACLLAIMAVVAVAVYFRLAADDSAESGTKRFAVSMAVQVANERFSQQFQDQSSQEFEDFQNMFCSNMTAMFSTDSGLGAYRGCSVEELGNGGVVKFTLFFVSTATPSVRALVTSLTKGPVSSAGTVTLPPGLGIAVNTVEVLKIADVPQDQFLPNVPVLTTPKTASSSTASATSAAGSSTTSDAPSPASGPSGADASTPTPGDGSNLTDASTQTPGDGSNLTDASTQTPGDGSNLTDASTPTPGDGSNLTDASTQTPDDGSNLTDASTPTPGDGSNLTDASTPTPGDGSNLTDASTSTPGDGSNLTDASTPTPGNSSNTTVATGPTTAASSNSSAVVTPVATTSTASATTTSSGSAPSTSSGSAPSTSSGSAPSTSPGATATTTSTAKP